MLGKRPRRDTRDAKVDLLLMKISDQYKLKKQHLMQARLVEANLKALMEEIEGYVYGYELLSEDDQ